MTTGDILHICQTRLDQWLRQLVAAHATPTLLVGVGHDHATGTQTICTPSSMSETEISRLLVGVLMILDKNALREYVGQLIDTHPNMVSMIAEVSRLRELIRSAHLACSTDQCRAALAILASAV